MIKRIEHTRFQSMWAHECSGKFAPVCELCFTEIGGKRPVEMAVLHYSTVCACDMVFSNEIMSKRYCLECAIRYKDMEVIPRIDREIEKCRSWKRERFKKDQFVCARCERPHEFEKREVKPWEYYMCVACKEPKRKVRKEQAPYKYDFVNQWVRFMGWQ